MNAAACVAYHVVLLWAGARLTETHRSAIGMVRRNWPPQWPAGGTCGKHVPVAALPRPLDLPISLLCQDSWRSYAFIQFTTTSRRENTLFANQSYLWALFA